MVLGADSARLGGMSTGSVCGAGQKLFLLPFLFPNCPSFLIGRDGLLRGQAGEGKPYLRSFSNLLKGVNQKHI